MVYTIPVAFTLPLLYCLHLEEESSRFLQKRLQCCLVLGPHDASLNFIILVREAILDTKLKMCSFESAVCAHDDCLNPIFLGELPALALFLNIHHVPIAYHNASFLINSYFIVKCAVIKCCFAILDLLV